MPIFSVLIDPLVALPFTRVTAEPKLEPSTWNWTLPVGVPEPGAAALTVTVKLIAWFNTEGLDEETTREVVPSLLTTWETADEVLPRKLPSPRYFTEMV